MYCFYSGFVIATYIRGYHYYAVLGRGGGWYIWFVMRHKIYVTSRIWTNRTGRKLGKAFGNVWASHISERV